MTAPSPEEPESWEGAETAPMSRHRVPRDPMKALLAAHVYGEVDVDTRMVQPEPHASHPRKRRFVFALVLVLLGLASWEVGRRIVAKQRVDEVRHQVVVLEEFLRDGSFEAVDELHRMLTYAEAKDEPTRKVLGSRTAQTTMQAADALLYRLWDADPARCRRIEARGPVPLWIQMMLSSNRERVFELERLESTPGPMPWNAWLRATAWSAVGDVGRADEAFDAALDFAPSNLPLLAEVADHRTRHGKMGSVDSLADQVRDIAPESPWVELLRARAARAAGEEVLRPSASMPAVLRAWIWLERAMERSGAGAEADAYQAVGESLASVGAWSPFIIDMADVLLASGERRLARMWVDGARWPDGVVADGIRGRLLWKEGDHALAMTLLRKSFEARPDPDVGLALLSVLSAPGAPKDDIPRIRSALTRRWSFVEIDMVSPRKARRSKRKRRRR